jgi:hypothetical protein
MPTRNELDQEIDSVQKELYKIIQDRAIRIPDCVIEEIAVYFVTKKIPTLEDWNIES